MRSIRAGCRIVNDRGVVVQHRYYRIKQLTDKFMNVVTYVWLTLTVLVLIGLVVCGILYLKEHIA
jgi:hypothetical protein